MKVFDLHADLAIAIDKHPEENGVLKKYWHDKFQQGEVVYTSAASFFRGVESWEDMVNTVTRVKNDIEQSGAKRILSKEDLNEEETVLCFRTI